MSNNINWGSVKVFINGIEMKGVTSVTYNTSYMSKKSVSVCKRLKTVGEIVANKSNLN